jgi:hypothetical protein
MKRRGQWITAWLGSARATRTLSMPCPASQRLTSRWGPRSCSVDTREGPRQPPRTSGHRRPFNYLGVNDFANTLQTLGELQLHKSVQQGHLAAVERTGLVGRLGVLGRRGCRELLTRGLPRSPSRSRVVHTYARLPWRPIFWNDLTGPVLLNWEPSGLVCTSPLVFSLRREHHELSISELILALSSV